MTYRELEPQSPPIHEEPYSQAFLEQVRSGWGDSTVEVCTVPVVPDSIVAEMYQLISCTLYELEVYLLVVYSKEGMQVDAEHSIISKTGMQVDADHHIIEHGSGRLESIHGLGSD